MFNKIDIGAFGVDFPLISPVMVEMKDQSDFGLYAIAIHTGTVMAPSPSLAGFKWDISDELRESAFLEWERRHGIPTEAANPRDPAIKWYDRMKEAVSLRLKEKPTPPPAPLL